MKTNSYVLIGLPGSGKTEWAKKHMRMCANANVWSLNALRYKFAQSHFDFPHATFWDEPTADQYAQIWEYCKADAKEFSRWAESELVTQLQELSGFQGRRVGYPLFIDNMNLYAPKRKQLVERLRRHNSNVIGVFMDTTLELCLERQQRGLDLEAMTQMYVNMDIPAAHEFDGFVIV
jgi:predicted kinase